MSAYGIPATAIRMGGQFVGGVRGKADDVSITGSLIRMTGAKRSSKPKGKYGAKTTPGEFSNRKLSIIFYSLCYRDH
jgi:hypothetical protein